jgi:hypothetical protein
MTVQDLITELEQRDPDAEVRIAIQPSYPLQSTVRGVVAAEDLLDDLDDHMGEHNDGVVWIVEGSQHYHAPYAPSAVFEVPS